MCYISRPDTNRNTSSQIKRISGINIHRTSVVYKEATHYISCANNDGSSKYLLITVPASSSMAPVPVVNNSRGGRSEYLCRQYLVPPLSELLIFITCWASERPRGVSVPSM